MAAEEELRKHRCCFAGPRFEAVSLPETSIANWLEKQIRLSIEAGFTTFITGMSMGTDILAGEIVVRLKDEFPALRLIAISPYPGFEQKWKQEHRHRYRELIRNADLLKYVCGKYEEDAIHRRIDYLLRHCSRLIAIENSGSASVSEMIGKAEQSGIGSVIFSESDQEQTLINEVFPVNIYLTIDKDRVAPEDAMQRLDAVLLEAEPMDKKLLLMYYRDRKNISDIAAELDLQTNEIGGRVEKMIKKLRYRARAEFLFGSDETGTAIQKRLMMAYEKVNSNNLEV